MSQTEMCVLTRIHFVYPVTERREDGAWVATSPAWPGLSGCHTDRDRARWMLSNAIKKGIEIEGEENGHTIPRPLRSCFPFEFVDVPALKAPEPATKSDTNATL